MFGSIGLSIMKLIELYIHIDEERCKREQQKRWEQFDSLGYWNKYDPKTYWPNVDVSKDKEEL